jgi:hypothetical protein
MVIFAKMLYMYFKLFQIIFQQTNFANPKLPRDPFLGCDTIETRSRLETNEVHHDQI